MPSRPLINATMIFTATLVVIPVVTLLVYLTGLKSHRSLYLNAIASSCILSSALIIFLTAGLYNGWKMKDKLGSIIHRIKEWNLTKRPFGLALEFGHIPHSLEPEGCLAMILVWLVAW